MDTSPFIGEQTQVFFAEPDTTRSLMQAFSHTEEVSNFKRPLVLTKMIFILILFKRIQGQNTVLKFAYSTQPTQDRCIRRILTKLLT